jgi:hypothetical protein
METTGQTVNADQPAWVSGLQQVFGGPSQSAFGSAVFSFPARQQAGELPDTLQKLPDRLQKQALSCYQDFCGQTWERFGPENWLGTWQLVHEREAGGGAITEELAALTDPVTRLAASTMLESHDDPSAARNALQQAFDDSQVQVLHVYRIGDGGAMSGLLIAARRCGFDVFLVFLLD